MQVDEYAVLDVYTRKQALAEGVLVDATELAHAAGYRIPVALTAAVWSRCVQLSHEAEGQDEVGRLWDVLSLCRVAICRSRSPRTVEHFALTVRNGPQTTLVTLKAVCGPDDEGSPCLTIMLPEED